MSALIGLPCLTGCAKNAQLGIDSATTASKISSLDHLNFLFVHIITYVH